MERIHPPGVNLDDRELVKVEAIIQSFTKSERKDVYALVREPSRAKRIAKGCGQPEAGVQELVQKFLFMKQMMGGLGSNLGFLGNVPGMKGLAMAKNMRKAAKNMAMGGGGMPGFPGMGGMGGMPGMGGFPVMPGMGGFPGMAGMPGMMGDGGE